MGPKKKAAVVVDGVDTTVMSREQLEQFALRLKEELDHEREERNYFQLERDKIRTFWDITKTQLEENRAEMRCKDRDMEVEETRHQDVETLFKQRTKHLLHEHQRDIAELRAEEMLSVKMKQEDFYEQESALLSDKKHLKEKLLEQQKEHQDEVRSLRMQFSEDLSKARDDFQTEAREIEAKYEHRLVTLRTELGLRHNMEITEVDERKNKQIADLIAHHETAFTQLKNYYNDITLNNLALINSMKEQMEEMKRREDRMEKALKECQRENRNLQEPCKAAIADTAELHKKLAYYERDKIDLANTKKVLSETKKELDDFMMLNDVAELRFAHVKQTNDDLKKRFLDAVLEVQQKSGLRTVMLEKKLKALVELLDQRESQFAEVMTRARVDTKTLYLINTRAQVQLKKRNNAIQDLEYELARVCKAHDDLLAMYEGKLEQYGIPREELGFTPLRTTLATAKGPAGLATCNK